MRDRVDALMADARMKRAFNIIRENEATIEADQIRLSMIAAPPFGEDSRAEAFAEELQKINLLPVRDAIGNVLAPYSQFGANPVVIGAHLDTIFPGATPLEFRRRGRVLCLPGIADNGSGLVAVLWTLRAAKQVGLNFRRPVIALGNVGEEGEGNLRGVRHLFNAPPWEDTHCDFIAVDGAGLQRITNHALSSRRFRVTMTGPGGHSWADFGRPNPVHAIANAIHLFTSSGTRRHGVSFNVGVIRGGISVNAIPKEAVMEVDIRGTSLGDLDDIDGRLKRSISEAVRGSAVDCRVDLMGDRPSGVTPAEAPIVKAALEVTRRFGMDPQLDVGSTDANIPMSMGIPAIAIGAGGSCGNVHTPEEWFDPLYRHNGVQRLLLLVALLAELL